LIKLFSSINSLATFFIISLTNVEERLQIHKFIFDILILFCLIWISRMAIGLLSRVQGTTDK